MFSYSYLYWHHSTKWFNSMLKHWHETGEAHPYLVSLKQVYEEDIQKQIQNLKKQGVSCVLYEDAHFPSSLRELDFPPWVITFKGDLTLLEESQNLLTVVGSRRFDPSAEYWLRESLSQVPKETVVVSGGAIGIDQVAHKAALVLGLRSVFVLPAGIFNVYPKSLLEVLKAFKSRNREALVLSSFHPHFPLRKSSFHQRNYIMAALSEKNLLVQAHVKSGSMVTINYALSLGKQVYAVPASPWDLRYSGNTKVLSEGAFYINDLSFIHL